MWRFWIKFWLLLAVGLSPASCHKPAGEPVGDGEEQPVLPDPGPNRVSVMHLKSLYNDHPYRIVEDLTVMGTVVATDYGDSFDRSLIIEDESGGIEIKVGLDRVHARYTRGRTVLVRCAGLVLGSYGGSLQLGAPSFDGEYECTFIPEGEVSSHVVLYGEDYRDHPTVLTPEDFSQRYVNCFVALRNVQAAEAEIGKKWAEPGEYTYRSMEVCGTGETFLLGSPPRGSFLNTVLPEGKGTLQGILRYFSGTYYVQQPVGPFLIDEAARCGTGG